MYAIMGATGKVGGGIAQGLLEGGAKVKAIGRSDAKLAPLKARGAEIALGDAADPVFLAKSFAGAECVFLMVPPDLATADILAHYERFGTAIAQALRESGVKKAVVLSSIGAELSKGNGPIAGLHQLERKLAGVPGVDFLILRPGYFMENHYAGLGMIKGMGINGGALRADIPMAQIATRDIAAYAVRRMRGADWKGSEIAYLLGPASITMQEATSALGKAIGKPDLKYVQFPYADAVEGMVGAGLSRSMAESFAEMSRAFNEGTIATPQRTPANTTPTAIEAFAQDFAKAFQAG